MTTNPIIIQKYGGSSVSTTERILAIAEHIKWTRDTTGNSVVVAISAMGDQTDELLDLAAEISGTPPKRELDMLLSTGERISMALLAIALDRFGVSTISLTGSQSGILTDEYHGNARISKVLGDRIKKGLEEKNVVIVAGFQGVSPKTKDITTLGRGGTDLTAVALAASLGAMQCELYKDVPGILHCDPQYISEPQHIESLPWEVMAELSWSGAGVVNARAVHLAQKYAVRMMINSFSNPQKKGTEIYGEANMETAKFVGIATKTDQCVVRMKTSEDGAFAKIVDWMWSNDETPLVNLSSGSEIVVSMRGNLIDGFKIFAKSFGSEINSEPCDIVTVAGIGLMQAPEQIAKFSKIVEKHEPIFVHYSNHAVRAAVPSTKTKTVVGELNKEFF